MINVLSGKVGIVSWLSASFISSQGLASLDWHDANKEAANSKVAGKILLVFIVLVLFRGFCHVCARIPAVISHDDVFIRIAFGIFGTDGCRARAFGGIIATSFVFCLAMA